MQTARNIALRWVCDRSVHLRRVLWPLASHESKFVHRFLDGLKGIEIGGAAHNDFGIEAINVDRYGSMDTIYKEEEWRVCGRKRRVDIIAPGDDLPFKDNAVDFVFASHVIEHLPDPIRALNEWMRVARRYVVLVVPHKERTFDHERELTRIEEFEQRRREGLTSPEDKHWSVWTLESFRIMCERFGFKIIDALDPDDKIGNGFMVALDASAGS